MDYDSLTPAQRQTYDEAVRGSHHRRVTLNLLDREHKFVASYPDVITGGGISFDEETSPAWRLTLTLVDPDGEFNWKRDEHRQYVAQVIDSRFISGIGAEGTWVDCVAFTGPLWDYERTGIETTLLAHSTEEQAQGSVRDVMTFPAKTKTTQAMKALLRESGAKPSDMLIPNLNAVLPERLLVGVGKKKSKPKDRAKGKNKSKKAPTGPAAWAFRADRSDTYWAEADALGDSTGRNLYADRRGRYLLAINPTSVALNLNSGSLVGLIKRRSAGANSPNTFIVLGKQGKKSRVISKPATFPGNHPLSAWTLRRNGKPRRVIDTHENTKISTVKWANLVARQRRNRALALTVEYEIEALPIAPWLEPYSLVQVTDPHTSARVRATRWSFPLGPDASAMTLGFTRKEAWRG